jgi:ribosome-binding ATPase
MVQVVRLFADDSVPHPDGSVDPMRDVATFETEFILADMAVLESRIEKIHKQLGRTNDEQLKKELPSSSAASRPSGRETLRNEDFDEEELQILRPISSSRSSRC